MGNLSETELRQRLGAPYEVKVRWAENKIREWYHHYAGAVYVAFSGGQDSQVLLHIVRRLYPKVVAVFANEPTLPEVVRVVKATPNVVVLKSKKTFRECVSRFGFPVISKEVARSVFEARRAGPLSATWHLRETGVSGKGVFCKRSRLSKKWLPLLTAPFLVTDYCCNVIKKNPAAIYQKATGCYPMLGTLASESNRRMLAYRRIGCNGFALSSPRSTPMAIWTQADVDHYRIDNGIKRAECYEMGYTRTGCSLCGFGCHMRHPNQFQLLHETHPKLWKFGMEVIGWQPVLDWLKIPSTGGVTTPANPEPTPAISWTPITPKRPQQTRLW